MDCERLHQGYSYQRISHESTDQWTAKDCNRDTVINLSAMRALINEWTAKDCIRDTVINLSAMRALINGLRKTALIQKQTKLVH